MGEIDLIFDDEIGICLCRDITDKAQLYHKGNRFERSRSVLRSKGDRTGDAPVQSMCLSTESESKQFIDPRSWGLMYREESLCNVK